MVVPLVMYGVENSDMRMMDRRELDVTGTECIQSMWKVDKEMKKELRRNNSVGEKVTERLIGRF